MGGGEPSSGAGLEGTAKWLGGHDDKPQEKHVKHVDVDKARTPMPAPTSSHMRSRAHTRVHTRNHARARTHAHARERTCARAAMRAAMHAYAAQCLQHPNCSQSCVRYARGRGRAVPWLCCAVLQLVSVEALRKELRRERGQRESALPRPPLPLVEY